MPRLGTAYLYMLIHAGLSPWTIRLTLCSLDRLADGIRATWHRDVGRVDRAALGPLPPRRLRDRIFAAAYSPIQAQHIIDWIAARRPQYALALRLQLAAGLRVGELTGLRPRMLDHTASALVITNSTITKGGRDRFLPLPLPPDLFAVLARRAAAHPSARLFPFHPDTLRAWVRRACSAQGIPSHGTHGFRHAFCRDLLTQLLAQGLPPAQALQLITTLLGHGRPAATRPYLAE